MTIQDRRLRERLAQRELIVAAARRLAESEGWEAVTTRRLSAEIEYSQPVIYKHFASLEDLTEAVALESFSELAAALRSAREKASPGDSLAAIARAYLAYAADHPALYDAMFIKTTRLPFGENDRPTALAEAYAELSAGAAPATDNRDIPTLTEVLWATLHGFVALERGGRLRSEAWEERLRLLVRSFG